MGAIKKSNVTTTLQQVQKHIIKMRDAGYDICCQADGDNFLFDTVDRSFNYATVEGEIEALLWLNGFAWGIIAGSACRTGKRPEEYVSTPVVTTGKESNSGSN